MQHPVSPSSVSPPLMESHQGNCGGGIWESPSHKILKQNLLQGLHARQPLCFEQEGFSSLVLGESALPILSDYGPALLPVNRAMASSFYTWLHQVSNPEATKVDGENEAKILRFLATIKTSWINHYRLCKALTYQTLPYANPEQMMAADTEPMLRELVAHVRVLKTTLVDVLQWPEEFWNVMLHWMSMTIPTLYGLGYHDAEAHAAQVARWCVLAAQIKAPNQPWFQLQAALVGWFHDPKLQVCMSIDNVATHPVLASCLADTFLQDSAMVDALARAKKKIALPQGQTLGSIGAQVVESLAINSDSRYVTDNFVLPAVRQQLPNDAMLEAFSDWLQVWNNPPEADGNQARCASPVDLMPDDLRQCFDKAAMGSGLLTLSAPVWHQACQWWQHTHGEHHPNASWLMALSPDELYGHLVLGHPDLEQAVYPLQQWLRQAFLLGEQPYCTWRVPATLLLTHHKRVTSPLLAECLAAADPLMLSPHKIIQARGIKETCVERVQSYLTSFQHNISDLRNDQRLPEGLVESWHRRVLLLMAQVAEVVTAKALVEKLVLLPTEDLHAAVGRSELWGELATVNETTEWGVAQIERITRLLKQAFETAEAATVDEVLSVSLVGDSP